MIELNEDQQKAVANVVDKRMGERFDTLSGQIAGLTAAVESVKPVANAASTSACPNCTESKHIADEANSKVKKWEDGELYIGFNPDHLRSDPKSAAALDEYTEQQRQDAISNLTEEQTRNAMTKHKIAEGPKSIKITIPDDQLPDKIKIHIDEG